MLSMPIRMNASEFALLLIFDDEGMDRIKSYDPAEIDTSKMVSFERRWDSLKLTTVIIAYLNEADQKEFIKLNRENKPKEAIKLVLKGWKVQPGDHNENYELLAGSSVKLTDKDKVH